MRVATRLAVFTASIALQSVACAQVARESPTEAFQRIYGLSRPATQAPVSPDALLQARKIQESSQAVPSSLDAYQAYLDQNPLIAFLKTNPDQGLFHVLLWNHFALDLTSLDHTTLGSKPVEATYAEQFGPHRAARALAIVHLAMFEAVNAIYRKYDSYHGIQGRIYATPGLPGTVSPATVSVRSAIAQAAYRTLLALYREKAPILFADLTAAEALNGDGGDLQAAGELVGQAAADAVLLDRGYDASTKTFGDGSKDGLQYRSVGTPYESVCTAAPNSLCLEPYVYQVVGDPHPFKVADPDDWDHWQQDPVTKSPVALGGDWAEVRPFALPTPFVYPTQYAPPAFGSGRFHDAYLDGGYGGKRSANVYNKYGVRKAGQNVSSLRTADLTFRALFWGYDATALLCAPPRLYNMIATSIAETPGPTAITQVADIARYLALVNLALADAGIAAWTGKYQYLYPRPVTYIDHHDDQTVIDGTANALWRPLGFAGTNSSTVNGTPPFPSNPSGHAVFGGALFEMMSRYFALAKTSPQTKFTFVSDEFNGINRDATGNLRPRKPITYRTFADAEWENAESRVWMGIHWQFDADDGISVGNNVADTVFDHFLKPVSPP